MSKTNAELNKPTSPSKPNHVEINPSVEEEDVATLETILEYSRDILEKKYTLYMWCEAKVQNLVTLNGLLIGGVFVMVALNGVSGLLSVSLLTATSLFLFSSLVISLWHIKPLMYSGRANPKNLRTVVGTEAYSSTEEYTNDLMKLSLTKMIELDADQIRGMNKNIMNDQRAINWGVRLTTISIFPLTLLIISVLKP